MEKKKLATRQTQKRTKRPFRNHTFLYYYHCIFYYIYPVTVFYRETIFVV